jgi:hypothetical protein
VFSQSGEPVYGAGLILIFDLLNHRIGYTRRGWPADHDHGRSTVAPRRALAFDFSPEVPLRVRPVFGMPSRSSVLSRILSVQAAGFRVAFNCCSSARTGTRSNFPILTVGLSPRFAAEYDAFLHKPK